jgi:hypothetical protein
VLLSFYLETNFIPCLISSLFLTGLSKVILTILTDIIFVDFVKVLLIIDL